MEQLAIQSYTDSRYTKKHLEKFSLPINPPIIKLDRGIIYNQDKQLGTINGSNSFDRYQPERLTFDFTIDCTGAVDGGKPDDTVYGKVSQLDSCLYNYNSESHRPSYVVIAYGELIFKGQLVTFNVDYQLFNSSGIPLRAHIKVAFTGFRADQEDKRKFGKLSPDMSRQMVIREGDTLAAMCQAIYGNSMFVAQVARINSLNGFRDIPPGRELLFPHLKKS